MDIVNSINPPMKSFLGKESDIFGNVHLLKYGEKEGVGPKQMGEQLASENA